MDIVSNGDKIKQPIFLRIHEYDQIKHELTFIFLNNFILKLECKHILTDGLLL